MVLPLARNSPDSSYFHRPSVDGRASTARESMANISYDHPTSSRAHPLPLKRSRRRESRSSIALSTPRWENISPSTLDHPPTRARAPPRPVTRRSRKPNEHPPTRAPHRTTARTALAPAPRSPGRQRANAGVERNPETTNLDRRVGTRLSESARRRTFSPETRWVVGAQTSRVYAPFASRVDVHVWANSTHIRDELPRASHGRPIGARRSTDRCSTSRATWATVVVMIFRLRARGRSPPLVQYVDVMDDTNEHMPSVASV